MRRLLVLLILAAVVTIGLLLLGEQPTLPQPVDGERPAARGSAPKHSSTDLERAQESATRVAVDDLDATPRSNYEIRIVDEHDRPVAGAEVAWQSTDEVWRWVEEAWRDRTAEVRAAGNHEISDARGRVLLPPMPSAFVVASAGDRSGQAAVDFRRSFRSTTVRIAHRCGLTVQAVNPDGRPIAGVPIEVAYHGNDAARYYGWSRGSTRHVGVTDGAGRVPASALESLRHWRPAKARVAFRALVLGATTEFVEVELAHLPELVEVPCPHFGRADVRITGVRGKPITSAPRRFELTVLGEISGFQTSGRPDLFTWISPTTVRTPPLALARSYDVRDNLLFGAFKGPRVPGEIVSVTAELRSSSGRVVRLFAPDGRVLADTDVCIGRKSYWPWTRSDAEGRVFATGYVYVPGLELWGSPRHATGEALALRPATITPTVAVDAATGEPVPRAPSCEPLGGSDLIVLPEQRLGENGRYRVATSAPGDVRLRWHPDDYEPVEIIARAGGPEVVARLTRASVRSLAVRVLVDSDVPRRLLHLRLYAGDSRDELDVASDVRRDRGGFVRTWHKLEAVPHRVEIALGGALGPIHELPQLRPAPPGRIGAVVDLRGRFGVAQFADEGLGWVIVDDGQRLTECQRRDLLLMPSDAEWRGFVLSGNGLPMWFSVAPGLVETATLPLPRLEVTCPGAGTAYPTEGVEVVAYLLRRNEPMLDRWDRQCNEDVPEDEREPPLPSTLAALDRKALGRLEDIGRAEVSELPAGDWLAHWRGTYALVPFVEGQPLLQSAAEVLVDGATPVVSAILALDPAHIAAARGR